MLYQGEKIKKIKVKLPSVSMQEIQNLVLKVSTKKKPIVK